MNLNNLFQNFCKKNNLEINTYQLTIIDELKNYYNLNFNKSFLNKFFPKKNSKPAFYLQGGVGVGKTMILNFFFDLIEEKKLRKHFNEFMLSFHDFAHERKEKNEENIINLFVKD
jgi:cell division protein ZapE